ncbi:signal peptidase II [Vibrio sp. SS-MA-C1-2]|uniref:signal peptidase II n=1 Tax=Vibrio sp. SS-MA-C1-2 TaxID=2908646 RepID=UPI001F3573E8|nr:signal peptidase II [Vibrio sp. SS-MA-C1-2]UJF19687.1 signal peptidase II [Vibrio sp. SS-MA-C1-2]
MSSSQLSIKKSGIRWLWLAILAFVLDFVSKLIVLDTMTYGWNNRIEVLPFFNLTYVHNYGAAFSFLSDAGGWQRWFFTGIAVAVCVLLLWWMRKTPATDKLPNIAYALVIGGAIGNLYDRTVHGFVIDFLDFYAGSYHWPAFNIADMAICIGAALLILEGFISPSKDKK